MWVTISVTACKGGIALLSLSEVPNTGTAKEEGMGRKMRGELEGRVPPKKHHPYLTTFKNYQSMFSLSLNSVQV